MGGLGTEFPCWRLHHEGLAPDGLGQLKPTSWTTSMRPVHRATQNVHSDGGRMSPGCPEGGLHSQVQDSLMQKRQASGTRLCAPQAADHRALHAGLRRKDPQAAGSPVLPLKSHGEQEEMPRSPLWLRLLPISSPLRLNVGPDVALKLGCAFSTFCGSGPLDKSPLHQKKKKPAPSLRVECEIDLESGTRRTWAALGWGQAASPAHVVGQAQPICCLRIPAPLHLQPLRLSRTLGSGHPAVW